MAEVESRWLLLIHQIPPKPDYFRVKIWRRLQRLGAVAIKNAVYALPRSDQAQEDFQWLVREVMEAGGDASVCEARFVEGLSDAHVEALFHAARDADYAQLSEDARALGAELPSRGRIADEQKAEVGNRLARLEKRLAEVVAIDFFGAPGRDGAEGLVTDLASRLHASARKDSRSTPTFARGDLRGRTWVTRKGIHVDRMASAWLILRFVDPEARFKFVPSKGYEPRPKELRFDMFEAEFTHEGDHCTLEVLIDRLGITEPALTPIAEIVHDIDLKDGKFARPETAGIDKLIAGIAMAHPEDEERLERATAVFDDLYQYFRRKHR